MTTPHNPAEHSPAEIDARDSDTTTGAGTTTGTGMNTVGGQTSGGPLTGGLAANAVTTGNASLGVADAVAIETKTKDETDPDESSGVLPDAGDTATGSMSADTAALGGATVGH